VEVQPMTDMPKRPRQRRSRQSAPTISPNSNPQTEVVEHNDVTSSNNRSEPMSVVNKVGRVGRDLVEINVETLRKFADLSADNLRKYIDLNQEYLQKLPTIREVSALVELQRHYGKGLWDGLQSDVRARGDILKAAVERSSSVVRGAFSESVGTAAT